MAVHEINIYGDIVPFKWFNDGTEYDLSDLTNSLSNLTVEKGDELIVNIHTFGGCTTTAFGIRNKLQRFKSDNGINLTTRVDGWCASSGVILLLSGDKRIGNQFAEPFVHNAWTFSFITDKNEAQKISEDLTKVDDQIATLYSQVTNITKEKALELMNADTYISAEDCMAYGFYTELENVYAAENMVIFNSLKSKNIAQRKNLINNMSDKNKEAKKNDLWKQIENFFKGGAKNKIVYTADNSELDFYELADDATPKAKDGDTPGDKAKFDGKPAGESNSGEYVMPSGETYKFTGEELTEIVPKSEDNNLETENAALKTENSDLKTEIENLKKEKTALNKRISDAESIIKNFKDLENGDEEDDEGDDPKRTPPANNGGNPPKRNLFKNIK